ncbi:TPA: sigma 54-interacting transcriptional regulator [Pseudomonas putida]|jgi:TyrR family helix-turn-helix protein|uniref:HTH-type transcriptional regulatory protein TyrR n=1 Tax=Pseudomonas putida (strain GB-1) TaxID=76869 RepID=B0KGI8_PSEPG|nr:MULTISPECIES: sigma-54-dependent transcriptional regulator [Pseudomonas]ABY98989.1 putative PAS/PAC sensor protein [Pseudomonas putida GB-1]APE99227.1 Fis family transcriptional regulator [Pseudomonas putida]MBP0708803.1 sigma-54-dependent transcriptional regulator [Pseudomonas sp. T34]MCE1001027.1 sigma-54-dependent transcriptional regulator [Pseudomonas sp. NMI1173_11]MCK2188241.1 sigma-54-dependent transcriptional regulator [Pseudomonas sp. MB04B]
MRIHVTFVDRVGITQEILSLLGARNLNLDAVEMIPPNVYIDAPTLSPAVLDELYAALLGVDGVQEVSLVDFLPGHRRRLQLEALLAAMSDPVLAVDPAGHVLLANPTLVSLVGREPAGEPLNRLFAEPNLARTLIDKGFRLPMCEVSFQDQPLLLEATPISGGADGLVGGLLTLYPASRIGERLASLLHDNADGLGALLGESAVLQALKARLHKVASLEAPLLIQGETGTGKELVARACHALSARRDTSFLALNCAALPESLAESELFGYAAGAFTGAQRGGKPGLLELADGGTVFLDEVGEMSPYLQAKLLRFLNDGSFRRVGGGNEVRVNVRVVCATHRNLESMVMEGSFREDLYYRLNVLNLKVPPLRERGKDILLLAEHFLRQACAQIQRAPCRLALATHPLLLGNRWSGNVRQLQNVIFRAAAISEGEVIDCDDLELAGTALSSQQADGAEIISLEAAVQAFEKSLLEKLYESYPSTRQLAVRLQTSHTAIGQRLRKYGIASRAL